MTSRRVSVSGSPSAVLLAVMVYTPSCSGVTAVITRLPSSSSSTLGLDAINI